jgi:ceramide glucosyltransferase
MIGWRYAIEVASGGISLLYACDRLAKLCMVTSFMRGRSFEALAMAPSVSLIQPITRGASSLADNLAARLCLDHPGTIQHIWICDSGDEESLAICRATAQHVHPREYQLVTLSSESGTASKIAKMKAGAEAASGEIICFIDDDVAPRPDNLACFVRELTHPNAGGVFGVACYTNWIQPGSAMMSAFVNLNALFTYIPITYLVQPFTVTGHFFALRRDAWLQCGGLDGLDPDRNDDDHEIARRLRKAGKRNIQSEAIYDVDNVLPRLSDYHRQMKRWSAFMRQWCQPNMTSRETAATLVNMIGNILPIIALACAVLAPSPVTIAAFVLTVLILLGAYSCCAAVFLKRPTTLWQLQWLVAAAFIAPLQMLISPLWGNVIDWRGRRYQVRPDGILEPVP